MGLTVPRSLDREEGEVVARSGGVRRDIAGRDAVLTGLVVVGAGEPRAPRLQLLEAELTRPFLRSNVGHAAVGVARVDPGQAKGDGMRQAQRRQSKTEAGSGIREDWEL